MAANHRFPHGVDRLPSTDAGEENVRDQIELLPEGVDPVLADPPTARLADPAEPEAANDVQECPGDPVDGSEKEFAAFSPSLEDLPHQPEFPFGERVEHVEED